MNKFEGNLPVRREDRADNPLYGLQREMNRVFSDFFDDFSLAPFGDFEPLGMFSPRVDVAETDKEIKVSAELPGLEDEDIEVSLNNNILTIRGEKKAEKEEKSENYYHMERTYGSFQRNISLPSEVEEDKVQATFKKGVLTVTLPKTAEAQQRMKKIPVKAGMAFKQVDEGICVQTNNSVAC